ncbi:hypothetical protein [Lottiidibacillus patelloidae]|uniref:hypothetical protein n=1 Tax=Lottiidibacillus patelloidae TaxID=2670334 RepID=UPI0013032DE3|nr:hypothetical protein [Lottiidibacillus patelloidae]
MNWFIYIIASFVGIYTLTFARLLWKEEKNKAAALALLLIGLVNIALPYFIEIR